MTNLTRRNFVKGAAVAGSAATMLSMAACGGSDCSTTDGGEKKKVEMLQLLLLRPKLAILDETDSGLDVDALAIVSRGISVYLTSCSGSLVMITHNTRILERLDVDHTHVIVRGYMVAEGPGQLIEQIDREGFERYETILRAKEDSLPGGDE